MDKQSIQINKWYKQLLKLAIEDFIKVNQFSRPGMLLSSHSAMVWHYTANPGAGADNHKRYFDSLGKQNPNDKDSRYASAHIFVDKDTARIIVPLWEVAYHAGNPWYNKNALSCELCVEKDGSFHPATIDRAVKIGALLQLLFGWKTDRNIRHYDVTGKRCPLPWVVNPALYSKFKQDVDTQIKAYINNEVIPKTTTKTVDNSVDNVVNIEINGKPSAIKGLKNGDKSYLPVRALVKEIGCANSVDWNGKVTIDGQALESTLEINDTGYAWARELANALDLSVEWDGATKTVKLKGAV